MTPSQIARLKEKIKVLEQMESVTGLASDWLTRLRAVEYDIENIETSVNIIEWNEAQEFTLQAINFFSIIYDEWGRGSGKTTLMAYKMIQCALTMPRGSGLFAVPSYTMWEGEISQGVKTGLSMNGYHENIHYIIGKKPNAILRVPPPYREPKSYDRCITFLATGFVFNIVSPEAKGAGIGTNQDCLVADEVYLISWDFLLKLFATIRNSGVKQSEKDQLSKSKWFGKILLHSTTAITDEGLDVLENLEDPKFNDELAQKGVKGALIVRANWESNAKNLPKNYADSQRAAYKDNQEMYDAQILNIRIKRKGGTFYTGLNKEIHLLFGKNPYNKKEKLYIGMDFGVEINCIRVFQMFGKEWTQISEHFVLGSDNKIHTDAAKDFAQFYMGHDNIIEFYFDNTGNNRQINSNTTFSDDVVATIRKEGLRIVKKTFGGANQLHHLKYLLWVKTLQGTDARFPIYKHFHECMNSWKSMVNSKIRKKQGGAIEKIKTSEQSSKILPQHATHFGDAGDFAFFGVFWRLLKLIEREQGGGYGKRLDAIEKAEQKGLQTHRNAWNYSNRYGKAKK
jgi:hypothetical protein